MTSGWEQGKLQELRAKTDRQLLSLVNDELEVARRGTDADGARAALQLHLEFVACGSDVGQAKKRNGE